MDKRFYPPTIIFGIFHYQTHRICRMLHTLNKYFFALVKAYAECYTRQKTLGKHFIGKEFFC